MRAAHEVARYEPTLVGRGNACIQPADGEVSAAAVTLRATPGGAHHPLQASQRSARLANDHNVTAEGSCLPRGLPEPRS